MISPRKRYCLSAHIGTTKRLQHGDRGGKVRLAVVHGAQRPPGQERARVRFVGAIISKRLESNQMSS